MKTQSIAKRKVIRLVNKIELQITELFKTDLLTLSKPRVRFLNKITIGRKGEGPMIA